MEILCEMNFDIRQKTIYGRVSMISFYVYVTCHLQLKISRTFDRPFQDIT